ncbi:branched-chain amino acid ABC transporter permease [Thermodesulfobacteriota bacterium]
MVSHKKWLINILLTLVLMLLPLFLSNYMTYLVNLAGIYVVCIIGLNFLMGLGGQMFFGAVAIMSIGAYSAALLSIHFNFPFYLSIPCAGLIATILSLTIIFPGLRVTGIYLGMVSLGFHYILEQIIGGWKSLTGGHDGLSVAKASIAGVDLASDKAFYYVVLTVVALGLWGAMNLMKMRVGRAIWALGQDQVSAAVAGINVTFYKIIAFLVCAFYSGISGGLLAHYLRYITPDHFTVIMSIMIFVGMIIGGWGSLPGSIAGGFFVIFLPEVIEMAKDGLLSPTTALYDLQAVISGIIIILVVMFIPEGVGDFVKELKLRLGKRDI